MEWLEKKLGELKCLSKLQRITLELSLRPSPPLLSASHTASAHEDIASLALWPSPYFHGFPACMHLLRYPPSPAPSQSL